MKLDRLLSRIRAALQGYASEFEQRALAAEYADLCAKVGERLEQVVPLIRQGQDFPALQIAESPPPVLDLVRQLSFAEAGQWRAFCRQHGLPNPRPFDERNVELVNQLYGKKISETHPLYREYRQAVRTRREDDALRVLISIRRVNPDDANAHAEFARLGRKLFERRRAELAEALGREDEPRILRLMESIEADSLPGRDQDSTWQQALAFREQYQTKAAQQRCEELAGELQKRHAAGAWREALPLLAEWEQLRGLYQFTPAAETEAAVAEVREWAVKLLAGVEHSAERQREWHALGARLEQLAGEDPAKKTFRTLREEVAELSAQTLALTSPAGQGGEPPPADLMERLQKETHRARHNLHRRQMRVAVYLGAAAAVVAVLAGIAVMLHLRTLTREQDLAEIQQHFHDGATNALAATLKEYDAHFSGPESDPAMNTLLEQARHFVNSHQAVVDRFDKELGQITQSAANPSPSQIMQLLASLDELDKETADLGAYDAQQGKAAVQVLRVRLTQRLAQEQDARAAQLAGIATKAEEILDEKLTPTLTADAAQPIIAEAKKTLAEADALPFDESTASAAEKDARTQLAALEKRVDNLAQAAAAVLAARVQLAQAASLDDYHAAIAALAKNALTGEPSVAAARAIFDKSPDWSNAAQRILMPGDPETWAFLQNDGITKLMPSADNQKEDIDFSRQIVNNAALGNIYRADLVTYTEGAETARKAVSLAGPPTSVEHKLETLDEQLQSAKKINPDGTTSDLSTRWVQFTGKKPFGDRLENIQPAPESKLVDRVRAAYDHDRNAIAQPLLRVLDDIRGDHDASPVLKAYLEQVIFQIMQDRPRDWGLTFSPKAQAQAEELASLTGGNLQPADWLFTAPDSRLATGLQAFYARTNTGSYFDDAEANLQALLKKRATPLSYAGYVDLDGVVHVTAPADATLWGLDHAGEWKALYHRDTGQPTPVINSPAPARLTPLVYLQDDAGR